MRAKTSGQTPIQTMITFMVIVTIVVAAGLGGFMWWMKKQEAEKAAKATQEAKPAVEVKKAFEHKPTESFVVFGFDVPPAYHFIMEPGYTTDGGGVVRLAHDPSGVAFRLEKKMAPKKADVEGAIQVYTPKSLTDDQLTLLQTNYNNQPGVQYVGVDELYLSDGTPYRLVAYYENQQTDPAKSPEQYLKVFTELVYSDGTMLEVMAYKPNPVEGDVDVNKLSDALQQFLVETGADRDTVLEMPDMPDDEPEKATEEHPAGAQ